jgi:hypothetical protein
MMVRTAAAAALALMLAACGETAATRDAPIDLDGASIDAPFGDPDADTTPDGPPAATARPGIFQTSGGGAAASASYRVRIAIGAPQPMGAAASGAYQVHLGPINP